MTKALRFSGAVFQMEWMSRKIKAIAARVLKMEYAVMEWNIFLF